MQALRVRTVVLPGGVVEIRSPDLPPPGTTAEVVVLFESPDQEESDLPPLASFVGSCPNIFRTFEEADEFLERERDSWD